MEEEEGGRQKARGPTFSTLALFCFTRHADLKARSVCVCAGKVRISLG